MSNPTTLTLRTWRRTFDRETGSHHEFQFRRFRGFFLEWEDLHFNHDSSVLIADHRDTFSSDDDDSTGAMADHEQEHVNALAIIASVYKHIQDNPEQKLLLTGHTDRSGPDAYNLALSQRRAQNVLFLLRGERERWAEHNSPENHHEVEDYQQILKWLFAEHDWDTDPGEIDDQLGPATRGAIDRFQVQYNTEFEQAIPVSGVVDQPTWAAFFDIYMQELQDILDLDAASFADLQQSLNFLSSQFEYVGCGENWPKTAQNRSRTDRRVELFFFDPGEEPTLPLRCHPAFSTCVKENCELRDESIFRLEPIPVEPILPPRYRLRVHLTLVWKDPMNVDHPFPKDMPFILSFADGSPEKEVKVGENGLLDFIVDKRKTAFSLRFEATQASYIVSTSSSSSSSDSELFTNRTSAAQHVKHQARAFLLPPIISLLNCDWVIDTTVAPSYNQPNFENLESLESIGTHDAPCRMELKLNWQYMKFLYFDRKLKRKLSVPPIMVEGFIDRDAASGEPHTQSNWSTDPEACQCLPWILRKAEDGSELTKDKILLQFRSKDSTFIDSSAAEASGGGRKYISKDSASLSDDPGLNEGDNSTLDFNVANAARLSYYDLPATWKSRTYFTKLQGETAGKFESLAAKTTSNTKAFLFSLDDLVLTDRSLQPVTWTADTQITNRVALFKHSFSGGSSNIGLYKQDAGNNQIYFSQRPTAETDRNYIADYPDWTRVVVAQGNLFDVFDKRVALEPDGVVGARAAVCWLDATTAPNFRQHVGLHPNGVMQPRPSANDEAFFSIQPMYEQRHHRWWQPSNRSHHRGIGRYDMVLLRCCDIADDGVTEVARCISYFRFFFNFNATFTPSNNASASPLGLTGAAANQWSNTAIRNLLQRWNGPDSNWNVGPAQITPRDNRNKLRIDTMWFAQALPGAIAHYELGVFQDTSTTSGVRAYMSAASGQGALDQTDNAVSTTTAGWFTFAHEVGHGASLQDEYAEPTTRTNLLAGWLTSFDCFSPGSPYISDTLTMMNQNKTVDARDHWHVAEWIRARPASSFEFAVKHGTYNYFLPHHAGTPAQTHISWPLRESINQTQGSHGRFDAFFYPLGNERFGADALPRRVGKHPGPRFDGLIILLVKLKFDFHIRFNATTRNNMHRFLRQVDQQIRLRFNNKFYAQGTVDAISYNRVLIEFEPRYWVINPGTDYSSNAPRDNSDHIEIKMKARGSPEWDASTPADAHQLHFPYNRHGRVFARFFAEMLGLTSATMSTASAYQTAIRSVLSDGIVHDI